MRVFVFGLALAGPAHCSGQTAAMPPMETHEHTAGSVSTSLVINISGKQAVLTLAELQVMPQRALTVHNAHNNTDESYTGVGLNDLLAKYGVSLDGAGARRVYHSYVKAEGTDGYWVLYSASEVEPGVRAGDALVALTLNGKPLTEDGKFKMVAGEEKKPARWVRNLSRSPSLRWSKDFLLPLPTGSGIMERGVCNGPGIEWIWHCDHGGRQGDAAQVEAAESAP